MKTLMLLLLAIPQLLHGQVYSVLFEGFTVSIEVVAPPNPKYGQMPGDDELMVRLWMRSFYATQFADAREPFIYLEYSNGDHKPNTSDMPVRFRGYWTIDTVSSNGRKYVESFTFNISTTKLKELLSQTEVRFELIDRFIYLEEEGHAILVQGLERHTSPYTSAD